MSMDRKYFFTALLLLFILVLLAAWQLFPPQQESSSSQPVGKGNILLALDQLEEYTYGGDREAWSMLRGYFYKLEYREEAEVWKKWLAGKL